MNEKKKVYRGISYAAWGYVFLYFHFKIGNINLLPEFVGYLLFFTAILVLKQEQRDMASLSLIAIGLAIWQGIALCMEYLGIQMGHIGGILGLIAGILELYFHFRFITGFAALAARYQQPEDEMDKRLLRWRTIQTVVLALIIVMTFWLRISRSDLLAWAVTILMIVGLVAGLYLMTLLFSMRKMFATEQF